MKPLSLCILSALLAANLAVAWGPDGHMLVAEAAYQKLTPAAKARVAALLKLNPLYSQWTSGVPAASRDETAFLMAAIWPDAIKSARGYVNDGEHPKSAGTAGRNIGYTDKLQHRYWHFVDVPFSPDGTPTVDPAPPNAQTQIAAFRQTLASSGAGDDLKSYDLVWLIHLVGDVHQPLHATSRFTKDLPDGDEGGNLVSLCANCRDELHGFWDGVPGSSKVPKAIKKQAGSLPDADATLAAVTDESKWIDESFQEARKSVYVSPVGAGAGPFTLTAEYRKNASTVCARRIALAGARLANLINDNLQ